LPAGASAFAAQQQRVAEAQLAALQHRRDGTSTGPFASCSCCDSLYEHAPNKVGRVAKRGNHIKDWGSPGILLRALVCIALHLQRLSNQLVQQRRLSRL
jgi:hypothetical protein